MGVNVVIFGDSTLVDLREDTVTPETLFLGETAHGKDGNPVVGTFTIEDEINEQDSLIEQIRAALQGKAAGSGDAPVIRSLSVTKNGTFTAPDGVDGYSPVVVDVPIPEVPDSVAQATPVITVSSSGLITAKATQEGGLVSAGTKSATKQLTTKGATTITPGASAQTAVSAGTFVTGDIKVAAVEAGGAVEMCTVTFDLSVIDSGDYNPNLLEMYADRLNPELVGNEEVIIYDEYDLLATPSIEIPKNSIIVLYGCYSMGGQYDVYFIGTSETGGATLLNMFADHMGGRGTPYGNGSWYLITGDATITIGVL